VVCAKTLAGSDPKIIMAASQFKKRTNLLFIMFLMFFLDVRLIWILISCGVRLQLRISRLRPRRGIQFQAGDFEHISIFARRSGGKFYL
jgi:hypothetical protein